jgi:Trk K+ transport system NAD-binding subunit
LSAIDRLGHLDLLRLLRSKVRFDLPGGRELQLGLLRPESRFAGKSMADFYRNLNRDDVEIVALIRREHLVLPHPNTLLQGNDRLILIDTAASRAHLEEDISPLPEEQQVAPLEE